MASDLFQTGIKIFVEDWEETFTVDRFEPMGSYRARISDVDEWKKLMEKLDSKVKELLKSGKDVELV